MRSSGLLLGAWLWAGALPTAALAAQVEGRIIHPQRPAAARDVSVLIIGVDGAGETVERSMKTDATGRFVFEKLPKPAAYLVTAAYDGIGFSGGSVIFREEDPEETKRITFHIYDRTSDAEHLAVEQIRLVLEREGGRYRARQTVVVSNSKPFVVLREKGTEPLLRLGLLSGHGPIRGPLSDEVAGAAVSGDVLELWGPVYPGRHETHIVYDIGGLGPDLSTELSVPVNVRELEIFIKDFGILVDGGELHPMKPAREGDVIYQRYGGFDLASGTLLPLRIQALETESTAPGWLRGGLSSLLVAGLLLFILRPVGAAGTTPSAQAQEAQETESSEEESTQEALHAALSDLEHDFETGKLSPEDRDRLRRDLKREALGKMERARASAEPAARVSCSCGNRPGPDDRFCSACGRAL